VAKRSLRYVQRLQLAFDHEGMNFKTKPVPDGSTVTYKIEVVDISPRPGSFSYAMSPVKEFLESHMLTILFFLISGGIWYIYNVQRDAAIKARKRKKAASTIKRATSKKNN